MISGNMKKVLITVVIVLSGCSPRPSLVGVWNSGNYSLWDKVKELLQITAIENSSRLVLNQDSSWQQEGTCQVFSGARWEICGDSLLLFPDTCRGTNNPLLNGSKQDFKGRHLAYKIKLHTLERHCVGYYRVPDKHDAFNACRITILEKLEPVK